MNKINFKDALWLMRFEMKHSLLSYLIVFLLYAIIFVFFAPTMTNFQEEPTTLGIDYHFLFILFIIPSIIRFQPFKHVHFGNYLYMTPFHILANQLPINRSTYIAYHFIYRFVLSTVVTIMSLLILYPFFSVTIPFGNYIAFILLWIALTYSMHLLDAYTLIGYHIVVWIFGMIVTVIIMSIIITLIFYKYLYHNGVVYWTLDMAYRFPIYTIIAAFLIIISNILFWNKLFNKKITSTDLFY